MKSSTWKPLFGTFVIIIGLGASPAKAVSFGAFVGSFNVALANELAMR